MYIPFRQGDVFRPTQKTKIALEQCFNPFGTGQCLTTEELRQLAEKANSLNPFGTGQCLTTMNGLKIHTVYVVSIPLEQGSVLRLLSQLLLVSYQVSIPLEQGSVLRLQWGHQALCDKAYRSHFPTFSETQRVGS